jgi:hypothetical protein
MTSKLLDALLIHGTTAILVVVAIVLAYLMFTSPLGHAYLCDTPGSKVCS